MTASSTGGSSGIAAIAAEIPASRLSPSRIPAQEAEAGGDRDQPDRDDEQDADESIELALQWRAATFLAVSPPAIRPTSVAAPIAVTMPSPRPPTTLVPE